MTIWDVAKPADADAPSSSASDLRNSSEGIRERLDVDHEMSKTGNSVDAVPAGAGHHKAIHLDEVTDPTVAADHGSIYAKLADGKCELFWKDEDGNVKQITKGGVLLVGKTDLNDVVDDSTIELDGTNGLQLKADGIVVTDNTGSYDIAKFASQSSNHGPPGTVYEGDWASCSAGDTKSVTHNLGSQALIVTVLVADDNSGTNCRRAGALYQAATGGDNRGAQVQSITTTTLVVQFGDECIAGDFDSDGNLGSKVASGYYKVVAMRPN